MKRSIRLFLMVPINAGTHLYLIGDVIQITLNDRAFASQCLNRA